MRLFVVAIDRPAQVWAEVMCGIAGFVGEGKPRRSVRMTNRVSHRGPDGDGFWTGHQVFFGHRPSLDRGSCWRHSAHEDRR